MQRLVFTCFLLCATLRPLLSADGTLMSALSAWSRAHDLTFTIEYVDHHHPPAGEWHSVKVPDAIATTSDEDLVVARKDLEAALGDWVIVPSATCPRVWHLIDRALLTRSPLDGTVSGLDHDGSVTGLIDSLAKDASLRVANPLYFTPGEASTGAHVHLTGFTGRIRDALTVSYPAADPLRPVLQWVAECEAREDGTVIATLRAGMLKRAPKKAAPAGSP